jgi:hypothetical protein
MNQPEQWVGGETLEREGFGGAQVRVCGIVALTISTFFR